MRLDAPSIALWLAFLWWITAAGGACAENTASNITVVRPDAPYKIDASDFGLKADGTTDDGPAIRRMLDRALAVDGPVELRFPTGKDIYVETVTDRYVFPLHHVAGLTIDGGGSTFLLHPDIRLLRLTESRNITLRRFNVDFAPLPFADGTVVAANPDERFLDVRLDNDDPARLVGGPTKEDGEQAFFSMLWYDGDYGLESVHCWTERIEQGDRPDTIRVFAADNFRHFDAVEPGVWRISVPVPGAAHRYGPGACFHIRDNDTLMVEDVELWSAPWFGFHIARNHGTLTFRRMHIRPKPDSGRIMSLWRDGFHVKGNSASLLWEDCEVSRMNDDAFNISTHTSLVHQVLSPTQLEVRQKFPLTPMPWQAGATLIAADEEAKRLLGEARISDVEVGPIPPPINGKPRAPRSVLTLDQPIDGLKPGDMVWDPGTSNPDTVLRRCRIERSCRMQSPMTLDSCEVTGLLWFYGEHVEGPFPGPITVQDCTLRRCRGNATHAVIFAGEPKRGTTGPDAAAPPRAIRDIVFERNQIWGGLSMKGVERARIEGNTFHASGDSVTLRGNYDVELRGNHGSPAATERADQP